MAEIYDMLPQNPWWEDKKLIENDEKLNNLTISRYIWNPRLKGHIDLDKDVVYSLRGPRQVGKTTLLKILIREQLEIRNPIDICYFTCDLMRSNIELKETIEAYLKWSSRQSSARKIIMIDEISRVENWELAIKFIVDTYGLIGKTFILTGSSSWDLKHSIERLPGRKGEVKNGSINKILLPMKFSEYVELKSDRVGQRFREMGLFENTTRMSALKDIISGDAEKWINPIIPQTNTLENILEEYLLDGGIMTAVNSMASSGTIANSIYELYLQFFFGDITKLGREEGISKRILSAIIKHEGKPIGWLKMAREADVLSPVTVAQYCELLQTLFAVNVYPAVDFDRKTAKHRSEKKIQVPNPFFFHAFRGYLLNPSGNYFKMSQSYILTPENRSIMAESLCGDHLARLSYNFSPSDLFDVSNSLFYYRTNKGKSIDYVVRLGETLLPVEVKYQSKIGNHDFNNLRRFDQGILVTKNHLDLENKYRAIPLSLFLMFV